MLGYKTINDIREIGGISSRQPKEMKCINYVKIVQICRRFVFTNVKNR